jgi:hypothetical protein
VLEILEQEQVLVLVVVEQVLQVMALLLHQELLAV